MKKIFLCLALLGFQIISVQAQQPKPQTFYPLAPELPARETERVRQSFSDFQKVTFAQAWEYFRQREGQPLRATTAEDWIELTQMRESLHWGLELISNARLIPPAYKIPALFIHIPTQKNLDAFALISKKTPASKSDGWLIIEIYGKSPNGRHDHELFIRADGHVFREIVANNVFSFTRKGFSILVEFTGKHPGVCRLIYGFSEDLNPVLLRIEDPSGHLVTSKSVLLRADELSFYSSLPYPFSEGINTTDPALQLAALNHLICLTGRDDFADDPESPYHNPKILNRVRELQTSENPWLREAAQLLLSIQPTEGDQ